MKVRLGFIGFCVLIFLASYFLSGVDWILVGTVANLLIIVPSAAWLTDRSLTKADLSIGPFGLARAKAEAEFATAILKALQSYSVVFTMAAYFYKKVLLNHQDPSALIAILSGRFDAFLSDLSPSEIGFCFIVVFTTVAAGIDLGIKKHSRRTAIEKYRNAKLCGNCPGWVAYVSCDPCGRNPGCRTRWTGWLSKK